MRDDDHHVYETTIVIRVMHQGVDAMSGMTLGEIIDEADEGAFIAHTTTEGTFIVPPGAVYPKLRDYGNDGTFFDPLDDPWHGTAFGSSSTPRSTP